MKIICPGCKDHIANVDGNLDGMPIESRFFNWVNQTITDGERLHCKKCSTPFYRINGCVQLFTDNGWLPKSREEKELIGTFDEYKSRCLFNKNFVQYVKYVHQTNSTDDFKKDMERILVIPINWFSNLLIRFSRYIKKKTKS